MEGSRLSRLPGAFGSPSGQRRVRRNRSSEWNHRGADSSSDNEVIEGMPLRPARSGDLSGPPLADSFSHQQLSSAVGFHSSCGAYAAVVDNVVGVTQAAENQLHYASQPVGHGAPTYQSLGRRRSRAKFNGSGRKMSSLSSSDNNSEATAYADTDVHTKMDVLHSVGMHSPPEPAPLEGPSKSKLMHMGRSLQRVQQSNHQYSLAESPESVPGSSVADYRLPGGTRGQLVDSPLRGFNSPTNVGTLPTSRLVLDFGGKDGHSAVVDSGGHGSVRPLVMPVYPTRATLCGHSSTAPPPAYSPQPSAHLGATLKQQLDSCSGRRWQMVALLLAGVSVLLLALVIYLTAAQCPAHQLDRTRCVLVEDALAVSPDSQDNQDQRSGPGPPENTGENVPEASTCPPVMSPIPDQTTPSSLSHPVEFLDWSLAMSRTIAGDGSWLLTRPLTQPQIVNLSLTVPLSARLAVLGCRNCTPSLVQHEFITYIRHGTQYSHPDSTLAQAPRHLPDQTATINIEQFMEAGDWWIAVYNGGDRPIRARIEAVSGRVGVLTCPNDCSGHGSCQRGRCICESTFNGDDCSNYVCPVLCSGRGEFSGGSCRCEEGWKGSQCEVPSTECMVPDCHGRGFCQDGQCVCHKGWTGEFCAKADCSDPTCSGHGVCVEGECMCHAGWLGRHCQSVDLRVHACLPDCSGHGRYDLAREQCLCHEDWTGSKCDKPLCELECGEHGVCAGADCQCEEGWGGSRCELRSCDSRCHVNGRCQEGECVCNVGFNGKHCTLDGCGKDCSNHGDCKQSPDDFQYRCECHRGWAGSNCSFPVELDCQDGIDNDGDGMTDCSDSECCWGDASCRGTSLMCLYSPEPVEVLLQKQPAQQTASFYQRVKFLIDEGSVQDYAEKDEYWESRFWNSFEPGRVAVIRGRVVTSRGLGIVGVRVSVNRDTRFGLTLSRKDGWFDIMVNGGGAVSLQFQRAPFRPRTRAVSVPWNQLVVLEPTIMLLQREHEDEAGKQLQLPKLLAATGCSLKLLSKQLKPVVVNTWPLAREAGDCCSDSGSCVFSETQAVQESLEVPGTGLRLVYSSEHASGYHSLLMIRLTPESVPSELHLVHLRVVVEGTVYRRTFEADPNITHTYAWNKRNVYQQKVFGVVEAKVAVGYQFQHCPHIVWETVVTDIPGFSMDISKIGGWNINIHHIYNFNQGILQKGGGEVVNFKHYPRVVTPLLGTGEQRSLHCDKITCSGHANQSSVMKPVTMATAADGSVYVGDFNLIRRVTPDGNVYTVVKLSSTQVSYNYYISVSPVDQLVYISDPESLKLYRTRRVNQVPDAANNLDEVAGTGMKCVPGDPGLCGDGQPAVRAKLAHPKGLALSADNEIFFADGTNIRFIDARGIIHTLIGKHNHMASWTPMPCFDALYYDEVQPQWPTIVALNPVDGSLMYVDDRLLLHLTTDGAVRVRLGRPAHCPAHHSVDSDDPLQSRVSIDALHVDWSGRVFTAATNPLGIQQLLQLKSSSTEVLVSSAGKCESCRGQSSCSCDEELEPSADRQLMAAELQLEAVTALAVSPDGTIHVADGGALKVYSLKYNIPEQGPDFKVLDPMSRSVYSFSRYGQHLETKDILTGRSIYLFQYTKNNGFGRLSKITDWTGNSIKLARDYSSVVTAIENGQGESFNVFHTSRGGLVTNVTTPANKHHLTYLDDTDLMTSYADSRGRVHLYQYDNYGRLQSAVTSSGETVKLKYQLTHTDAVQVSVSKSGQEPKIILINPHLNSVKLQIGNISSEIRSLSNSTISVNQPGNMNSMVYYSYAPQLSPLYRPPMQILDSGSGQFQSVLSDGRNPALSTDFRLNISPPIGSQMQGFLVAKTLQMNGTDLVSLDYDAVSLKQRYHIWTPIKRDSSDVTTSSTNERKVALTVQYEESVAPSAWMPSGAQPMLISYDSDGRVKSRQWNQLLEKFTYGRGGVIKTELSATSNSGSNPEAAIHRHYTYDPNHQPATFTMEGGQRQYEYHYDSNGGLQFIVTPNRARHFFVAQPTIGAMQLKYSPPGAASGGSAGIGGSTSGDDHGNAWIWHYSGDGRVLAEWRPGGSGCSVFRYDASNRLKEEVQGDGDTQIEYHHISKHSKHSKQFEAHNLQISAWRPRRIRRRQADGFSVTSQLTWQGPVLRKLRQTFGSKWPKLVPVQLQYDFNQQMKLTAVEGTIGERSIPPLRLDPGLDGRLGPFRVWRPSGNHTVLYDGVVRMEQSLNDYLQPSSLTLSINGYQVYRRQWHYDQFGRLSLEHVWRPGSERATRRLTYGSDGQLVSDEGAAVWRFQHDSNANLVQISVKNSNISLQVDDSDRTIKLGSGVLHYDAAGALVENFRGDRYQYDSRGLLISASGGRRNRFHVHYRYDHQRRLVARHDNHGNMTQLVYADLRHPNRPSHFRHVSAGSQAVTLTSIVYDDDGRAVRVDIDDQSYIVVSDWCGSPQLIFSRDGRAVRELSRSAYGHRYADTWPQMALMLDYCGGVYDPDTEMIHLVTSPGRVYDPLLGQLIAPDVQHFTDNLMQPDKLHLYRINGNKPLSLSAPKLLTIDDFAWLKRLGYSFKQLFPRRLDLLGSDAEDTCSRPSSMAGTTVDPLQVMSSTSCRLQRLAVKPHDLGLISPVTSMALNQRLSPHSKHRRISSRPGPLGPGAVLERGTNGLVKVWPVPTVDPIAADVLDTVFSGSFLLNVTGQHRGRMVLHLCQPDLWRFASDVKQLSRLSHYNVSSQAHGQSDSGQHRSTSLRVHTGNGDAALLHVRYGVQPDSEFHRLVRHNRRQAVKAAWWRERKLLQRGFSNHRWTANERQVLLSRQHPPSVETFLRYSPERYPELSSDPFNVQFGRR